MDPKPASGEKEALRIQAAAVAAQQAALAEEERRLCRRQSALKQQEAQLAAHLDEKYRRLVEARDQLRLERLALQNERSAHDERLQERQAELQHARHDVDDAQVQARVERRRLLRLRRRLRQRFHRHWLAERQALSQREGDLVERSRELQQQAERLQARQSDLERARLRFDSDSILARKRLESEKQHFRREQVRWCELHQQADQDLRDRATALRESESTFFRNRRELEAQAQDWHQLRARLQQEVDGLEARIHNHRQRLLEQRELVREEPARAVPSITAAASPALVSDDARSAHFALYALAGELADQRLALREHVARLNHVRDCWDREREALIAEFEAAARALLERERSVETREQSVQAAERACHERQARIDDVQRHAEVSEVRLAVRAATCEAERDCRLADIQSREHQVERREAAIALVRERWQEQRRSELARLREEYVACARLREAAVAARDAWVQRQKAVVEQQRALVERHALLRRLEETAGQTSADAAVNGKLSELRGCVVEFSRSSGRVLRELRQGMSEEAARLESCLVTWRRQVEHIARREFELGKRQSAWEHEKTLGQQEIAKLRHEAYRLRLQRDARERQLAQMSQEIERLAHCLLASDDGARPTARQAA